MRRSRKANRHQRTRPNPRRLKPKRTRSRHRSAFRGERPARPWKGNTDFFTIIQGWANPMTTMTTKQRLVNQLFSCLAGKCKADEAPTRPVLEEFIYAILREGQTPAAADSAFESIK